MRQGRPVEGFPLPLQPDLQGIEALPRLDLLASTGASKEVLPAAHWRARPIPEAGVIAGHMRRVIEQDIPTFIRAMDG